MSLILFHYFYSIFCLPDLSNVLYLKIIDKDHGVLMRPMPGMVGLVPSGSKVSSYILSDYLLFVQNINR